MGCIWNQHLHKGLIKLGFQQSAINECIYSQWNSIFLCYVDDMILINPNNQEIDNIIQELKDLHYDVTDESDIKDYLAIRIEQLSNGQANLNDSTTTYQLNPEKPKAQVDQTQCWQTLSSQDPACSCIQHSHPTKGYQRQTHKEPWSYHSVIGKLNFLEKIISS